MKPAHSAFAQWMNDQQDRHGPVIADRAKIIAIPEYGVATLLAYIHNNPVRAQVVARAAESTWTSHLAYLGADHPPWLDVEAGLARAGFEGRATDFDAWVDSADHQADRVELKRMYREARALGAIELGTPLAGPVLEVPLLIRRDAAIRPSPRAVLELVAQLSGVAIERMCSRQRQPELVDARRVAIHVAREAGIPNSSITAALGVSHQLGSRHATRPLAPDTRELAQIALGVLRRTGRLR